MRGRSISLAAALLVAGTAVATAQDQPIKGPEDAKCRDEARDGLFSAPNPNRLPPYDLGAQLYHACMRRLGAEKDQSPRAR